jgi:hypothetical protein
VSSRHRTLTLIAWVAFVASFLLPTVHVKPGGLFGDIDAGWKAFTLALSMALKPDRFDWFWGLCIAGVLANVAVLVAAVWALRRRPAPVWLRAALTASFVLNLAWIPLMSDSVLIAGYWLWIGSLGMFAVVGLVQRRSHDRGGQV